MSSQLGMLRGMPTKLAKAAADAARAIANRDRVIIDAYNDGASLAAIAAESGLTEEGVRKLLQRNGVPLRPRGRPTR